MDGTADKLLIIDDDQVFVGSANLDPRSLRINTEMGLLIESPTLNHEMRKALEPDFSPRNSWRLQHDEDGRMTWISDDEVLDHQPTSSHMRRIEDWFLSLLPMFFGAESIWWVTGAAELVTVFAAIILFARKISFHRICAPVVSPAS